MDRSESIKNITVAMAKVQKEIKQPLKDANNPFFKSKYVPLENVVEAITDIAPKHGISFTQYPLNDESGQSGIGTILMHESGEFIEYPPFFMKADKNTPQGNGAVLTYIKRYVLSAVFGITSDNDDDGNVASGNQVKQQPKKQTREQKKATATQKSEIEKKAKEFAKLRNETVLKVMSALKISDLNLISEDLAEKSITTLDGWLKKASEDVVS